MGHRKFGATPVLCIVGLENIFPSENFLNKLVQVLA